MFNKTLFTIFALLAVRAGAVVTLSGASPSWELKVDGKPFYVHGITFGVSVKKENVDAHMAMVKSTGANAIRTWGSDNLDEARMILDSAQRHGIKVMAGLWLRHGRAGAEDDDAFNWIRGTKGKQKQWDDVINQVKALKDHPALLFWGLGNEVILNIATDAEKKAYSQFLGKLAKEIRRIDPHHPIASASAWSIEWPWWQDHAPDITIYGVNTYGGGASVIHGDAEKLKTQHPYLLTEFGARGEWDAPVDKNGLKIEPADPEKEGTLREGFPNWIESKKGRNIGGFIFNYGTELNHAGIWLNLFVQGAYRPSYWGARSAFSGLPPKNRWPEIKKFEIPKDQAAAGAWVQVDLQVSDPEKDKIAVSFYFNQREGSRQNRDAVLPLESRFKDGQHEFKAPNLNGLLKIYVFVKDSFPNLSIAQCSIKLSAP